MGNTVGRLSKEINLEFEVLEKLRLLIKLIPQLQAKTIVKQQVIPWIQEMREYNYFSSQRGTLEMSP